MRSRNERGFSLIELLIVITLMAIIFGVTIPFYRRYVAQTELRNVAQALNSELVTAHNNAINGVVPKDSPGSTARYYWVVHVHKSASTWEYETGACPLQPAPPAVTTTVYNNQFAFMLCGTKDYLYHTFPIRFSISHQYSSTYSEANIYFEPISGQVKLYDIAGAEIVNPDPNGNVIDIVISSVDYPQLTVTFHVNKQGTISQETS